MVLSRYLGKEILHNAFGMGDVLFRGYIPDLDKTWDETLVTFLILGLRDFFLDAKRSVYVFLVQS